MKKIFIIFVLKLNHLKFKKIINLKYFNYPKNICIILISKKKIIIDYVKKLIS